MAKLEYNRVRPGYDRGKLRSIHLTTIYFFSLTMTSIVTEESRHKNKFAGEETGLTNKGEKVCGENKEGERKALLTDGYRGVSLLTTPCRDGREGRNERRKGERVEEREKGKKERDRRRRDAQTEE